MTRFVRNAVSDMTGGRETWRVRLLLGLPAFTIAVSFAIARLP